MSSMQPFGFKKDLKFHNDNETLLELMEADKELIFLTEMTLIKDDDNKIQSIEFIYESNSKKIKHQSIVTTKGDALSVLKKEIIKFPCHYVLLDYKQSK